MWVCHALICHVITFDGQSMPTNQSYHAGDILIELCLFIVQVGGTEAALFDYGRGGPQWGADALVIGPPQVSNQPSLRLAVLVIATAHIEMPLTACGCIACVNFHAAEVQ